MPRRGSDRTPWRPWRTSSRFLSGPSESKCNRRVGGFAYPRDPRSQGRFLKYDPCARVAQQLIRLLVK